MNNKIKLVSIAILGIIFGALVIILIVYTVNGLNGIAARQLVSGIIPVIVVLFLAKLKSCISQLKKGAKINVFDRSMLIWGLVSADFIFALIVFCKKFYYKKITEEAT